MLLFWKIASILLKWKFHYNLETNNTEHNMQKIHVSLFISKI